MLPIPLSNLEMSGSLPMLDPRDTSMMVDMAERNVDVQLVDTFESKVSVRNASILISSGFSGSTFDCVQYETHLFHAQAYDFRVDALQL